MRRFNIPFLCLMLLAASWQQARGFALLGPLNSTPGLPSTDPDPTWQTVTIGYNLPGDVGTPKNFNQGYRRNTPVMYYGFDSTFAGISGGFFGLQGEQAVDGTFAILNNTFTNNSLGTLDGYSTNLVEFPFNSQNFNYTALSLAMTDVKSTVLYVMMEELGLAEPARYAWTLHDRSLPPGGKCPIDELYTVVQRNFYYTPTPLYQTLYSPYVNDTLYTYSISEICSGAPTLAVTVPTPVDPYARIYNAVADNGGTSPGLGEPQFLGLAWSASNTGGYYTGLTRDDVGGLRYLLTTNNIQWEDPAAGSQLEVTNFTLQPLKTTPLGPLLQFAQTNPPAAVQAFDPTLVIDSVSNYFTLVTNWTIGSYFTNFPGSQAGTAPTFVIVSNNPTFGFMTNYVYTFGNMVIVSYSTNTPAMLVTTTLGNQNGQQFSGTLTTNITTQVIYLNQPSGEYYTIPTNSCGLDIVVTNKLHVFAGTFTNSVTSATNTTALGTGFVGTQVILESLTNSLFQYYACNFATNGPAYYQGIGRMQFVRIPDGNIDSLTGLLRIPITNTYSMVWYNPTNSRLGTRVFQRVLAQPDILFSSEDLATKTPRFPVNGIGTFALFRSDPSWDVANILPGFAGPGTINPPIQVVLSSAGNLYGNGSLAENGLGTNAFLSGFTQTQVGGVPVGLLQWASFDGTTNAPIVYPNGTSLQNLENELVMTVTPPALPDGTNNVMYPTTTFNVTGGQPPFSWSSSGNLPEGLSFFNGVLSGTPVNNSIPAGQNFGTFDFTIVVTGADNRTVSIPYSINIYQSP